LQPASRHLGGLAAFPDKRPWLGYCLQAIAQTTLDLDTQGDGEETCAAQGAFLKELALPEKCGLICGLEKSGAMPVNP